MARPEKPDHERREPRSISLRPADWALLEALGGEVGFSRSVRSTTSEAVRFLLQHFLEPQEWRVEHERGADAASYITFKTGETADGTPLLSRVNPLTGETQKNVVRPGPFGRHRKTKPGR